MNIAQNLVEKIEQKEAVIGIIGLGYVGVPLMLCYADKNHKVIGFDIDEHKISLLQEAKIWILLGESAYLIITVI